ncbi:hypothetical protein D9615_002205 [Tricholomella constricta]|uniref:MYND-type domain-containing protein n=1 Tax=Tricholomella constricta TaxID=117010 RepID=A0A8H5HM41_9AGAR|nr:hypothetical protein D9615_002205 [Tricholomella constricta]
MISRAPENDTALRVGSGLNGQALSRPLCGNTSTSDARCQKIGILTCSKVCVPFCPSPNLTIFHFTHSARYCSKECQTMHWKTHRIACKGPYTSPSWLPAWATEKRNPAFMETNTGGLSDGLTHDSFGLPFAYLWGNLPAVDCLHLSENERVSASRMDLKLCFAASGDIRNLVKSVNGLPADYEGKCDIVFNDLNPLVVGHNLVVLWALLNSELAIDDAAELALHLMYSSCLTPNMAAFLSKSIDLITGLSPSKETAIPVRGRGELHARLTSDELGVTLDMLRSRYGVRAASYAYSKIMCSRERQDYTDRHLFALEPGHRLAFTRYRKSGILAPYSLDTSHFEEPNRLLYSPGGDWLMRDSDSPLTGWDLALVLAYGQNHGVDRADVYGCLFFYVKNELAKFATKLRDLKISITLTRLDAQTVPDIIRRGELPPFSLGCFDRIETSNIADYIPVPNILRDWSPLLNRHNKFAVLLVYFMNWQMRKRVMPNVPREKNLTEKYASIMGLDLRRALLGQGPTSPSLIRFVEGMSVFTDDYEAFQSFLKGHEVDKVAAGCNLRLRIIHRIHPKRAGVPLAALRQSVPDISKSEFYNTFVIGGSESTTRFVEFEACK